MDKIQETYNLPKLNKEESANLNRQITTSKFEGVIENSQQTKVLSQMASQVNLTRVRFKEHLSFSNYCKKFKRRVHPQAHFMMQALF